MPRWLGSLVLATALSALLIGGCHLVGGTGDFTYDAASGGAGAAGGGSSCDPSLCPGLDEECLIRSCTDDSCGFSPLMTGVTCTEPADGVCDGEGSCVECNALEDCDAGELCVARDCVPEACADGEHNGQETDVDCGGSECSACDNDESCSLGSDCKSGFCDGATCQPCGAHADCPATEWCDLAVAGGTCVTKSDDGAVCGAPAQCKSGFCPNQDGVCCSELCAATCEACAAGKTGQNNGICALVDTSLDPDPDGECALEPPSTCGSSGQGCAPGATACLLHPNTTVCAAQSCAGSTVTPAATCDGDGSCVVPPTDSCAPYQCNEVGTACLTSCSDELDCSALSYCNVTGSCLPKKPNGQSCAGAEECLDGNCVDGVCCDTPCNATCVACSAAKTGGANGTCALIPSGSDPDGECDGADACDGAGTCACAGVGSNKPLGTCCATGAECASGSCADGLCCDSACNGSCESCDGADTGASDGTCSDIVAGTDPDGECASGALCDTAGACSSCGVSAPATGGMCPATCTGGCVEGGTTCVIDCLGVNACKADLINCPAGFDCRVRCGPQGCRDATVGCPATEACDVRCESDMSCRDAVVQCGSGTCDVSCSSSNQSCFGTDLTCGVNACTATCSATSTPTVTCGPACSCDPC